MKLGRIVKIVNFVLILSLVFSCNNPPPVAEGEKFASFTVDPKKERVEFFWKDDDGRILKSIGNLREFVEKKGKRLRFAMNGGMYAPGSVPKGLFVQNRIALNPLDAGDGDGNFYLKPNGVFYLTTEKQPVIVATQDFRDDRNIEFATQSGPLLVVDGKINPEFKADSINLQIRNGVGILPDNKAVFIISRQKVNFYEFAQQFQKLKCREALYLDGYVSRMYLPEEKFEQFDGDFAAIIGVVEENQSNSKLEN